MHVSKKIICFSCQCFKGYLYSIVHTIVLSPSVAVDKVANNV